MGRLKVSDLGFSFGAPEELESYSCHRHTCCICGARFNDHNLPVFLAGHPWGAMCGDCLTTDPKRLGQTARERAAIVRTKRPPRGYDADANISWAKDLIRFATILETVNGLDAIPGGLFARKIGEGYRELDPQRNGKAA